MASNDLGEFTPLVPGSNGYRSQQHTKNHSNNAADPVSRRRNGGNNGHHHHHQSHHEHEDFSNYYTGHKNDDRRTYWARIKEALDAMPLLKGKLRARTAEHCGQGDGSNHNNHYWSCYPPAASAAGDDRMFYMDSFNDESWSCSFGTREHDGIWLNVHDRVGVVMSSLVWVLILYSGVTVGLLSQTNRLPPLLAKTYFTICALALASHAKTTFTDPGAIPSAAVPVDVYSPVAHAMCSRCQSYKPKGTHHCRICDRCISGMDHHCPWMNNCIGTGNLKHFILFLCYTWTASAFALLMFGWNYFFCSDEHCTFSIVAVQLVRVMTVLCISTLIFTSSMLTNVTYGVMTGVGTIDRLKMKATADENGSGSSWGNVDEMPLEWTEIFGVGPYWTWLLPFFDPVFEDYDLAMGYSTPQRLLRERV